MQLEMMEVNCRPINGDGMVDAINKEWNWFASSLNSDHRGQIEIED